jgi:hypothetical protein
MSRDPTEDEIGQLQILDANAGSPAELRRWVEIARARLRRSRGRPAKADIGWLLCAAALQRENPLLSRSAAIGRVVKQFWWTCYAASPDAFQARLLRALGGRSLAEFAKVHESTVRVDVHRGPGSDLPPGYGPGFSISTPQDQE